MAIFTTSVSGLETGVGRVPAAVSVAVTISVFGRVSGAISLPKKRPLPSAAMSIRQAGFGAPSINSRVSRKHRLACGVELANTSIQVRPSVRL
ncbi:hypothetical protein D3C78_1057500 [compost metagenome]